MDFDAQTGAAGYAPDEELGYYVPDFIGDYVAPARKPAKPKKGGFGASYLPDGAAEGDRILYKPDEVADVDVPWDRDWAAVEKVLRSPRFSTVVDWRTRLDLREENVQEWKWQWKPINDRGWSVFPQKRLNREPGIITEGGALFKPTANLKLDLQLFSDIEPNEAARINRLNPWENIAMQPRAGGKGPRTAAFDIDVGHEETSLAILRCAWEIFGPLPIIRAGRYPKLAFVVRIADGTELPHASYRFADADGGKSEDQIEILTKAPLTIIGQHHRCMRNFWYPVRSFAEAGPEDCPEVTMEAFVAFMLAVEKIRAFYVEEGGGESIVAHEYDPASGLQRPVVRSSPKYVFGVDGRVTDGRRALLRDLAMEAVIENRAAALDTSGDGRAKLLGMVVEAFQRQAVLDGEWAYTANVRKIADSALSSAIAKARSGGIRRQPKADRRPRTTAPKEAVSQTALLSFLGTPGAGTKARAPVPGRFEEAPEGLEAAKSARAIREDRSAVAAEVSRQVNAAIATALDDLFEGRDAVHLVMAPAGSGKTTNLAEQVLRDPRLVDTHDGKPIIVLVPTHDNASELAATFENLKARYGAIHPHLRGLEVLVYQGKGRDGMCRIPDVRGKLAKAGVMAAGLCEAPGKDGEPPRRCVHWDTCPAIAQRRMIKTSPIIVMPHAYLTVAIPHDLKDARFVVCDERIFQLLLHTACIPLSSLRKLRIEPRPKKVQRRAGITGEDIWQDRQRAIQILLETKERGECPRAAFHRHVRRISGGKTERGIDLVRSAKQVLSATVRSLSTAQPNMTPEEIAQIGAYDHPHAREEYRLWAILEEALENEAADDITRALGGGRHMLKNRAPVETRLQWVVETAESGATYDALRVSWRTQPNWKAAPWLLLDASANRAITRKIMGRDVTVHEVEANENVHRIAIADRPQSREAFVPRKKTAKSLAIAATNLDAWSKVISTVSVLGGEGRVVIGGGMTEIGALIDGSLPANVDHCHNGAMRGLNSFKNHRAALSIGRMEPPVRSIDGLQAALGYDDDEPELPFDARGDGLDDSGQPLRSPLATRRIPMRSGHDYVIEVPEHPGKWGRLLQQQYREEELRQFFARLRTVYREGEPPLLVIGTSCIPEGTILDDVTSLEDWKRGSVMAPELWAALQATGVIDPDLIPALRPDIISAPEAVRRLMAVAGLDGRTGTCRSRWARGLTAVRMPLAGDTEPRFVYVLTHGEDHARRVTDAARQARVRLGGVPKIAGRGTDPVDAPERAPDRLDAEIGPKHERVARETRDRSEEALAVWGEVTGEGLERPECDRLVSGVGRVPLGPSAGDRVMGVRLSARVKARAVVRAQERRDRKGTPPQQDPGED